MAWWLWMILGLVLALAEAQIPSNFFLLAFGVAGVIVGALAGLGWGGPSWLQWLTFTVLAIAAAAVFNRVLARSSDAKPFDSGRELDNLIGEPAVVIADVPAQGVGRAELRGTTWSARASGGDAIPRDTRCRVERVDGLTLWLRRE